MVRVLPPIEQVPVLPRLLKRCVALRIDRDETLRRNESLRRRRRRSRPKRPEPVPVLISKRPPSPLYVKIRPWKIRDDGVVAFVEYDSLACAPNCQYMAP